eukprot:gene9523-biopygen6739
MERGKDIVSTACVRSAEEAEVPFVCVVVVVVGSCTSHFQTRPKLPSPTNSIVRGGGGDTAFLVSLLQCSSALTSSSSSVAAAPAESRWPRVGDVGAEGGVKALQKTPGGKTWDGGKHCCTAAWKPFFEAAAAGS